MTSHENKEPAYDDQEFKLTVFAIEARQKSEVVPPQVSRNRCRTHQSLSSFLGQYRACPLRVITRARFALGP